MKKTVQAMSLYSKTQKMKKTNVPKALLGVTKYGNYTIKNNYLRLKAPSSSKIRVGSSLMAVLLPDAPSVCLHLWPPRSMKGV